MKKTLLLFTIFMSLMAGPAFAANYIMDYLESGNIGGWGTSLKTFDDEIIRTVDGTFFIDIWMQAGSLPDPVMGGFWIDLTGDENKLTITEITSFYLLMLFLQHYLYLRC